LILDFCWRWAELNASFFPENALSGKSEKGLFSSVGEVLSSLRLTIGLLIVLAVASIFGTVIPQNASPEEYLRVYKLTTFKILHILGLLDMYHSWWFVFLLTLLCLNLVICSIGRFRVTRRLLSPSRRQLDDGEWKALSPKRKLSLKGPPADWLPSVGNAFSPPFPPAKALEHSGAHLFFSEKGRLSRYGVYFVHLGVLVILVGAMIGLFYGFRGNINFAEGETITRVTLRNGQQIPLPGFQIKLEKFTVAFYPNGAPKEFKSVVTISEGDQKVLNEPIRVNHPLTFKGLSFYQSNYGVAGVEKAALIVKEKATGKEYRVEAQVGVRTEVGGGNYSFTLTRFLPDVQGLGPAFQVMSFEPNRPHENFMVFQNRPEMEDRRPGPYRFMIREIVPKYYSGLQVNKDPGVSLVWIGCALMIIGFYFTFVMSHRRLWMRLSGKGKETLLEVVASSHRNRVGFEQEFDKLFLSVKEKLSGLPKKESKEREGRA
jgi:cytochrome c biogenesis protein